MPRFAPALAVAAALFLSRGAAAESPLPLGFDPIGWGGATHVVVTDPDGRVLESWRGDLQPGQKITLGPEALTLTHALPWELHRLRPVNCGGMWYHATPLLHAPDAGEPTGRRLVLFLRREGEAGSGPGVVWMPAFVPDAWEWGAWGPFLRKRAMYWGSREFREPDVRDLWATNVAWIEDGQVLAAQLCRHNSDRWWTAVRVAVSPAEFRRQVVGRSIAVGGDGNVARVLEVVAGRER